MANAELRAAKQAAHSAFDATWKGKCGKPTRSEAYAWLAKQMELPQSETHIGMFDVAQCQKVAALCAAQDFEDIS